MASHITKPDVTQQETKGITKQVVVEEKPTPPQQYELSPISELQSVFGTLLLARKTQDEPYVPSLYRREYIKPQWTEAFGLFSLPRELRDRIYYHYLVRHKPAVFSLRWINGHDINRRSMYSNCFSRAGAMYFDKSDQVVSLYCTNKQVFQEAIQVFFRYNVIEVQARTLQGTFPHFPDHSARLVQRMIKSYDDGRYGFVHSGGYHGQLQPDEMWSQMIRDAHFTKSCFPRLREYIIEWYAWPPYFAEHGLRFAGATEEEKIEVWYEWMMGVVEKKKVVPAPWIKIKMASYEYSENGMQKHESALQEAYRRVVKKTAGAGDEGLMLEESKKLWLEELELEEQQKKGRKRKRRERWRSGIPAI